MVFIDAVRSVSSIIFGVSGAWLALTYPKAILSAQSAIVPNSCSENKLNIALQDNNVLLSLISTMLISTIIIGFSLGIPIIKEILSFCDAIYPYKQYLRALSFYLIFFMSLTQIFLLYKTLKQSGTALRDLRQTISEAQTRVQRQRNSNY